MEANRDAAKQCLNVSTRAREDGDLDKARRFAEKSHTLFPTSASETFLEDVTRMEANRDAAKQSLIIATRCRNSGDLDRALKFAQKSQDLSRTAASHGPARRCAPRRPPARERDRA